MHSPPLTHIHTQTNRYTHTHKPCRPTIIQHLFMFSTCGALNTFTNVKKMLDEPAPCYQRMCLIMAHGINFLTAVLRMFPSSARRHTLGIASKGFAIRHSSRCKLLAVLRSGKCLSLDSTRCKLLTVLRSGMCCAKTQQSLQTFGTLAWHHIAGGGDPHEIASCLLLGLTV
jgi:hypothetical protein